MEELVPDKEICQEAKDKGLVIESEFWWCLNDDGNFELCPLVNGYIEFKNGVSVNKEWLNENDNYTPAPLTDEILKRLPVEIKIIRFTEVTAEDVLFDVRYFERRFIDKKLSNALYRLAINLFEEGIIK